LVEPDGAGSPGGSAVLYSEPDGVIRDCAALAARYHSPNVDALAATFCDRIAHGRAKTAGYRD